MAASVFASKSPLRVVAASILLASAGLAFVPGAKADHIGSVTAFQTTTLGLGVTIEFQLMWTGNCCGGDYSFDTGDGATGSVGDGVAGGFYAGDGSGWGYLSDGRTFTWSRSWSGSLASPIVTQVTIPYNAIGFYTFHWEDCCTAGGGYVSGDVAVTAVGAGIGSTPTYAVHDYDALGATIGQSYTPIAAHYSGFLYDNAVTLCDADLNSAAYPPTTGSCVALGLSGPVTISVLPGISVTAFSADFSSALPITIVGYDVLGNVVTANTACPSGIYYSVRCGITSPAPLVAVSIVGATEFWTMDTATFQ